MTNNTFDTVKIKFEKFLSLFGNVVICEKERNIIQNKLRRHFNTTTSDYLCSNEFEISLDQIINIFGENNKSIKYYTLLASFDEQLKKYSIKSPKSIPLSINPSNCSSTITINIEPILTNENLVPNSTESTIEYEMSISAVQETIQYLLDQCCNILSETLVIDQVISLTTDSNNETKHERKIIRLERRLSRLSRIIRELEEKDMSLDEMIHCDLYVVESNLKKQACEIHTKLTKLKSQSSSIERIIHQPITLNESEIGHSLLNNDLQEMVNQSKHFPSFSDVLETVEKANDKHKLNFNDEDRRIFAEKAFKIIGKEIKNRRMADFQDIMYSRLPEDFNIEQNDPALNSVEFEKVLSENQREAVTKTEKIFEEFARIDPDPVPEINIESSEEESEMIVDTQEVQYDIVNMVPPFSSQSPTSIFPESNSIETKTEISLNDRRLTVLSTASLPLKRTTCNDESEICNDTEPLDSPIETLVPRRKQNLNDNEIIYKLYKDRLTNNKSPATNKRSLTKTMEYSNVKKTKQQHQPEIIVLD